MATPRGRIGWAMYDWASSGFAAVVGTFVFPAYFASEIVRDETLGTTLWGNTIGTAGIIVAVGAPLLGAIADQAGRLKTWLAVFTLLCIIATCALWWVRPQNDALVLAMLVAGFAIVAAEFAGVFYNAMLPTLTSYDRLGRWSGWAWGLGYMGGISCLILALLLFVREPAWIPIPRGDFEHVRATFVLVAAWYGLFALPLFWFTPDFPSRHGDLHSAVRVGLARFGESMREVRANAPILRFLVARLFFSNGLGTMFAFGGVYAAGTFAMDEEGILLFGIALNLTAGAGAATFAWVDDWIGSRLTILLSLAGLLACGILLLAVHTSALFWTFGMLLGVFVGPVQAAGRSWLARSSPEHLRSQMFGLFAFSGKATAFAGPLLVGWVTGWCESQRAGMSVIMVFLAIGLVIMLGVPEARPESGTEPR